MLCPDRLTAAALRRDFTLDVMARCFFGVFLFSVVRINSQLYLISLVSGIVVSRAWRGKLNCSLFLRVEIEVISVACFICLIAFKSQLIFFFFCLENQILFSQLNLFF